MKQFRTPFILPAKSPIHNSDQKFGRDELRFMNLLRKTAGKIMVLREKHRTLQIILIIVILLISLAFVIIVDMMER